MIILLIFLFSILGSIGAIITASILLLFKGKIQMKLVSYLISYATGTLLAAALLGMIPEALSQNEPLIIMSFVLGGIILFFFLEKMVIWRHCHDIECEIHSAVGSILLIGDAFHNFIDGVVIAVSFLISIPIGIIVGLSVIAHEVPQEVGDFAILIESGYSKRKAFLLNLLSSSFTIPGALIGYCILDSISVIIPFVLAISAASFIYIALTDLTPNLHRKIGLGNSIKQIIFIIGGIGTIILIISLH